MGEHSKGAIKFINSFLNNNVKIKKENINSKVIVVDTMFEAGNPDYIDKAICEQLKGRTETLVMINSGMNLLMPNSVDVLIDHLPNAKISGNEKCKKYIGFEFSPVSNEFVNKDDNLILGENLLFVIGGNDSYESLTNLISVLNEFDPDEIVDLIISTHYPTELIDELLLSANFNLKVYQNVENLAPFFKNAHSVICTYGNTTYESLTYHRPTFTISYEKFQHDYSNYLQQDGLVFNLGYLDTLSSKRMEIIYDNKLKYRLLKNSVECFKRPGIINISNVLMHEIENV